MALSKILIIAHGDDEILFFNPTEYDKIIFVFKDRLDVPKFGDGRMQSFIEHPMSDKIRCVGLTESNYWRDSSKLNEYIDNYLDLREWLKEQDFTNCEITTHDAQGEYGHADHKLVYTCVMDTVSCKVNGQDPLLYREIKNIYKRNGVWTYYIVPENDYLLI